MLRSIFILLSCICLSNCAHMHAQNCSENAGYEKGYNDAKMGRLMFLNQFSALCSAEEAKVAQQAYKNGYESGKNSMSAPQMNLTLDGGKIGLVGAHSCQISYQGETFSDNASSESAARNNVLSKCQKKFPSCSERSIACSKN